jgi:hypothetical protein
MKVLRGISYFECSDTYGSVDVLVKAEKERLGSAGIQYATTCLTLNPPGPPLSWKELDARWKRGDKTLMRMYEGLEKELEGKDVLINEAGINLHPEFVAKLPVFTVFSCMDDPENSHNLSKPAAAAYDLSLVGNIAEVDTYKSWGVRNAEWIPLGYTPEVCDAGLTYEEILNGERDIDLFMMIDRMSPWRKPRMDMMHEAFPDAHFFGKGWPRGFLGNADQLKYLRRSKIGPNFHNSTGPINFRTFYLPANGVMQICDNKSHLGKIYELGKEVVGFDSVKECIDLCRYYLDHDRERREIAANGWKRATKDYNEVAVYRRKMDLIERYRAKERGNGRKGQAGIVEIQLAKSRNRRMAYTAVFPGIFAFRMLKAVLRKAGINKKSLKRFLKPG